MAVKLWTRREALAALHVYLQLPFGQLHQRQPKIKQLAEWIGRTPGSVALKLVNFASLDPQIRSSGRVGMANASSLDESIWQELQERWDSIALEAAAEYEHFAQQHGVQADADIVEELTRFEEGKTRSATVQVRVNQARFRKAVLTSYNATCCISGLQDERLVIASHIVPWSRDTKNRLNPQNGLCLSALHDRAYDQGLITVLPDLTIRVSDRLMRAKSGSFIDQAFAAFDGEQIRMPERFRPGCEFLDDHAKRFGFKA